MQRKEVQLLVFNWTDLASVKLHQLEMFRGGELNSYDDDNCGDGDCEVNGDGDHNDDDEDDNDEDDDENAND